MKKVYLVFVLSLLITSTFGHVASAQGGNYMSEEEYRQVEQDHLETKADKAEYELESKVAAAEEQEKKEQAEADDANKQLLMYVVLGVGGIILIYYLNHLWQKHTGTSSSRH